MSQPSGTREQANVLALSQVDAGYGATTVVRGVNLDVAPGSVIALPGEQAGQERSLGRVARRSSELGLREAGPGVNATAISSRGQVSQNPRGARGEEPQRGRRGNALISSNVQPVSLFEGTESLDKAGIILVLSKVLLLYEGGQKRDDGSR